MTGRTLIVLAGLLGAAGCHSSSEPTPVFLGHVATLSGADRSGERTAQGIRLAAQELNEGGLGAALDGRPLHVRHTDARGQVDAFEAEAVRLATVNRVAGLIGGTSAEEVARLDRSYVPVLTLLGYRPDG